MNWLLILIPILSATIGWITNWLAVKMLFHPRQPVQILGITFQGIFPKRQQAFAEKLGKLVHAELFSLGDIEEKLSDPSKLDTLMPVLEEHIDNFLKNKLKDRMPMVSMFLGENTIQQFKTIFVEELKELFPVMMKNYVGTLKSGLDLEKIVINKISTFSAEKLETFVNRIFSKEFKIVHFTGAIIGFLIGMIQVVLIMAFGS